MRVVQVCEPGAPLELIERALPEPGPGKVRIKVEACGICHSDSYVVERHLSRHSLSAQCRAMRSPAISTRSGPGVTRWRVGQRVGVGWHGGHCGDLRQLPAR